MTNHNTGDKCVVKFIPYSYFSREHMRRVRLYCRSHDVTRSFNFSDQWECNRQLREENYVMQ